MNYFSFFLIFLLIHCCIAEDQVTTNSTTTNATKNSSNNTCSANPLCANNSDNFTCVDEPYKIDSTDFCSTFFENNTQSCCSKEYLDKLEENFLYYKNLLRGPAIETDDAIENISNNQSNFTEEILDNIEKFANETEPVNITRLRRTLLRKLTDSLTEDTSTTTTASSQGDSTTSSTTINNKFSINAFATELIAQKEKTLLKQRENALLLASKSCKKAECKASYISIKNEFELKIKTMKTTILTTLSKINSQEITIIAKFEAQINLIIGQWEIEYNAQKELEIDESAKEKIGEIYLKKKAQLLAYLEKAKALYSTNSTSSGQSNSGITSSEQLTVISEDENSQEIIKSRILALEEKFELIKQEAKNQIEKICQTYKINKKDCDQKQKDKLEEIKQNYEKEKEYLNELSQELEKILKECKEQGYSEKQCIAQVNVKYQSKEKEISLSEYIIDYKQQFANELEEKCLAKSYTAKQCENFVKKTLEEANKKAEQLQQQQEITNAQIQQVASIAIQKCKSSKKKSDDCKTEVEAAVSDYSNKISAQLEKTEAKEEELKEKLTKSIEQKCKKVTEAECEKITEQLTIEYENSIKKLYQVLSQPVAVQETYEASETLCVNNEIGESSDQCSEIIYDQLKKIKQKKAKLGIDSSTDEALILQETIELYSEIKKNCTKSKKFNQLYIYLQFRQKQCESEVEVKIEAAKKQHKEQLISEITVNDTLIDLSPLLKGKLNKQLQNQLPIKNLNGLLHKYQNARKKCFSFILKLKTKFSCLACAGPSFFDQFITNGKLHFHSSVCNNTMKHCYEFFDLNEAASIAKNNIEALNESYYNLENINKKVENITKLIKELKKEKKSKSSEQIAEKISSIIDQIHEIEDLQGSKLQSKFITKRKPKYCSSESNCSYICDNFFSFGGLNLSIINDPGIKQEVTEIEETVLDVYENTVDIPIEFVESNASLGIETDLDLLDMSINITGSISIGSEVDTMSAVSGDIYNADNFEININNRRRLAEVEGSYVWDDNGMNIELIASGIDDSLLEFEENPKEYKDNYAQRFSILILGLLAVIIF